MSYEVYVMIGDTVYGFEDDKEAFSYGYAIQKYAEYSKYPLFVESFRADQVLHSGYLSQPERQFPCYESDAQRLETAGYIYTYKKYESWKSPKGVERSFLDALKELDKQEKEFEELLEQCGKEFDLLMEGWEESSNHRGRWHSPHAIHHDNPYSLEQAVELLKSPQERL